MLRIGKHAVRTIRHAERWVRSQLLATKGVSADASIRQHGRVFARVVDTAAVSLGKRVVLNASMAHNTLEARGPIVFNAFRPGAIISIGDDSGLTSCTLSAGNRIEIGERVLIGGGVLVTDSDHHVVGQVHGRRFAGLPAISDDKAIKIGDDVFIGARAVILKGVEIGSGSVIGAGSVVSTSIPANVVAAGNPCRVVRHLSDKNEEAVGNVVLRP